jgi:cell division GTPase FtsZ
MASKTSKSIRIYRPPPYPSKKTKEDNMSTSEDPTQQSEQPAPTPQQDDLMDFGDLDFADHYGDETVKDDSQLLPENTATSAINCAFVGFGGGGGKLAKSFLDLGYNRTLLINTTHKDQPEGIKPEHFLLLEGADGVGKDVNMGKKILNDNATFIEDTLRARLGEVDWLFVCASGGGGTGSASASLHDAFQRYLDSVQGNGKVVYLVSTPTSQELLNPTIKSNCSLLCQDVKAHPHVIVDNEKQLQLLRGKVGMLGMYPAANKAFSKMLAQIFKLAAEPSPIQSFDTKDLEKCLATPGRMSLGTIAVKDFRADNLGMKIFKGCTDRSPCPTPAAKAQAGVLLLVTSTDTASDPTASNQMEAAISYVGGRSDTLFSGVYVRQGLPGLVAIMVLCGM